jgi:superfamily II DNA or RNA helicase
MSLPLFQWAEGGAKPDDDGLRWYQRECVAAVERELSTRRSTLVVAATGAGKTTIFGALIAKWKGPVLVLAHRDELVQQARDRIEKMTGEYVEVEQGPLRCGELTRIVVGSVQTLCRDHRLQALGRGRFTLIVADECHHALAKSWRKVIDYFGGAKLLGVTATPDRGDGEAMGKIFESVAYRFGIEDAIDHGYLLPIRGMREILGSIDLDGVSKTAGDLATGKLDEVMLKAVEGIVRRTLDVVGDQQTIAFFPGVKSAELAAARFNALKPDSAMMISGMTDPDERKALVRDFKRGRYQFFCNCAVATEGFDAPTASVVVIGRPTLSRSLYAQMAGRGMRILPGIIEPLEGRDLAPERKAAIAGSNKPHCTIIDFVGNSSKHSLASVTDILGGRFTDKEVERAKKIAKHKKGGTDPRAFLEQARRELLEMAAQMKSKVTSKAETFNPFTVSANADRGATPAAGHLPMLREHREQLLNYGMRDDEMRGMSRADAEQFVRTQRFRAAKGLASYKQLRMLMRFGVGDPKLTKTKASEAISYIMSAGYKNVDPQRLSSIVQRKREPGDEG